MPTATQRPSADRAVGLVAGSPEPGLNLRYTLVNEVTPDSSQYVYPIFASNNGAIGFNVDATAGSYSGRQIDNVRVDMRCSRGAGFAGQVCSLDLVVNGTAYSGAFTTGGINQVFPNTQLLQANWATNPDSGNAWTSTEIELFGSSSAYYIRTVVYTDDTAQQAGMTWTQMVVTYTPVGHPRLRVVGTQAVNRAASY